MTREKRTSAARQYLTIPEARAQLSVSRNTFEKWIDAGLIRVTHMGCNPKIRRIDSREIDRFIRKRCPSVSSAA